MEISKRKEKDIVVISVKGRMDAVTSPAFEKDISDLISKGRKHSLSTFPNLIT